MALPKRGKTKNGKITTYNVLKSKCVQYKLTHRVLLSQLNREGEVLKTPHGILMKSLAKADGGLYHCLATENNFKHTLARVSLRILDRDIAVALTTPDEDEATTRSHHKHHHQDPVPPTPASLLEPELRLIQQYCQSYWEQLTAGGSSQDYFPKRTSRRHTEAQKAGGG